VTNPTSSTHPAPTLEGYDPPTQEAQRERMLAQARKLPRVDHNGRDLPRDTPDPSVTNVVPPPAPGQVPTMAEALAAAAEAVGADLPTLLDSRAFVTAITPVSPNNPAELQSIIRQFQPAPAAPVMAPNPAQGSSGIGSAPAAAPRNLLERLQQETAKHADAPLPPGSTTE
jgi:hypothetical protein